MSSSQKPQGCSPSWVIAYSCEGICILPENRGCLNKLVLQAELRTLTSHAGGFDPQTP